ncbi:MAG: YbbR-like domain-containing protein [Enterococcus sp.]
MISREKRTNLFYGLIAFLFSILLFFTANGSNISSALYGSESYDETVSDVAIQPLYDADKYYIHGFDTTTSVKLTSANRIQLNAEKNPDTRTFRVTADLTDLTEGTHEVELKVQGLSSAVSAKIEPKTITVTIEKKVTKEFEVTPEISATTTPSGFEIGEASTDPEKVSITTGDKTLAQISKVVAKVDDSKITDNDISQDVDVKAVDTNGESLSIVSDPPEVNVTANVIAPKKTVSLYAIQEGTPANGISHYEFSLSRQEATVSGTENQLAEIESIGVPINVTGIQQVTTRTETIPVSDGLTVSPKSVKIEVTPIISSRTSTTTEQTDTTTSQSSRETSRSSNSESTTRTTDTSSSETTEEQAESSTSRTTESTTESTSTSTTTSTTEDSRS